MDAPDNTSESEYALADPGDYGPHFEAPYVSSGAPAPPPRKIVWPDYCISADVYKAIKRLVAADTQYWVTHARDLPAAYQRLVRGSVDAASVFSLRNSLLKHKIIRQHWRVRDLRDDIVEDWERGKNILTLSHLYDYPPRLLFRAVLTWTRIGDRALTAVDVDKIGASGPDSTSADVLTPRERSEFVLAWANDAAPQIEHERAFAHEAEFVDLFADVPHRTERDLVDAGATMTPDILLLAPGLEINGTRVYWIDYKDYVGTPDTFLTTKNCAQAAKYKFRFGPGALVFSGGYVCGMEVPGALLLRAQDCPLGKFSPS